MNAPALASILLTTGCYQSLGAGYTQRYAERGGPSFEGQYLVGIADDFAEGQPATFGKVTVAGGDWGVRASNVIGAMLQLDLDSAGPFFCPGLAFLVLGAEVDRNDSALWVGLGAELEAGLLVPLGDKSNLELGVRGGGDLSYTGRGAGAFAGIFLAFGWVTDGLDFFSR